jgi:hypothetical protein
VAVFLRADPIAADGASCADGLRAYGTYLGGDGSDIRCAAPQYL